MHLVAHSGGMGWDEAIIFVIPVVILGVLQLLARRKAREAGTQEDSGDEGDAAG
jgi:hypothetical protein